MHAVLNYRTIIVLAMIATLATYTETAEAETNIGCLSAKCSSCDCALAAKMADVEKSCFEVETKTICIPRVVFPWQHKKANGSCDTCDSRGCVTCVNNGARTRSIRVLKQKKYMCPECKYSWTPKSSGNCDGGCDAGCAKTEQSKLGNTKVVSYGVLLPLSTSINPRTVAPSELLTSELESVHVETSKPFSSVAR